MSEASGAGFQVMCAVPLRVRTDVIGALNLFRTSDEPFTATEMEIAQAMAEMAAIGLASFATQALGSRRSYASASRKVQTGRREAT